MATGTDNSRYERLVGLARSLSGQVQDARKAYLLEVRLKPVMDMLGVSSIDHLLQEVGREVPSNLASYFADALVDDETWFFRERHRLQIVGEDIARRAGQTSQAAPVRVWCAGGSTGQEAYSLAILLDELMPGGRAQQRVSIVTSDIGYRATNRARAGTFSHFEIQHGLSTPRMLKHFSRTGERDWLASAALREQVQACHHNLLDGPLGAASFDVVICRNVLSGMEAPELGAAIGNLVASIKPGGCLSIGREDTVETPQGVRLIADTEVGSGMYRLLS